MYPTLGLPQPTYDQYGNQCSVNPMVTRSTAGALAPGQALFSCDGRIATTTTAATTIPLVSVPPNMVLYITDFCCSTAGTSEVDAQIQSGTIPIDRASVFNTSPAAYLHETQPMAIPGNVLSLVLSQTTAVQNVNFFIAGYFQAFGQ
jgi:hypothetical protein